MTERVKKYLSILELRLLRKAISFRRSEMDFLFYSKMEKEIWKDIVGYEGKYQVSNYGRVKSLDRKVKHSQGGLKKHTGRILVPSKYSNGYCRVSLNRNLDNRSVHRLVGEYFISNPENKPCINHIDGVRTNNRVDNLEWVTYSENERHSYDVLGKVASNKGVFNKFGCKVVGQFTLKGKLLKTYPSASEVSRQFKCSKQTIIVNCNGKCPSYCGFVFKYI